MLRIVLGVSALGALLVTYWVNPMTAWIVLGSSFTLAIANKVRRARIEDVFSVSQMAERMTEVIVTEWQRSQDRFMSRLARPFNREIALR